MALVLVCYITFLGATIGVYEDNHLGVALFRNALSGRGSILLRVVTDFALAALILVTYVPASSLTLPALID